MTYPPNASNRGQTMRTFELTVMDRRPDGSESEATSTVGPFVREVANDYADKAVAALTAAPTVPGTMRCWRLVMMDRNPAFGDEPVVNLHYRSGFLPLAEANDWFGDVFAAAKAMPGWGGGR